MTRLLHIFRVDVNYQHRYKTMNQHIHYILLVFSFVSFAFAAWQYAHPAFGRFLALGLALLILSMLPW